MLNVNKILDKYKKVIYVTLGMFALGVTSALNRSISNELRCSFRLDSLC
jgi:hypothetical protein